MKVMNENKRGNSMSARAGQMVWHQLSHESQVGQMTTLSQLARIISLPIMLRYAAPGRVVLHVSLKFTALHTVLLPFTL